MTNVALVLFEESISELAFSNANLLTLSNTKAVNQVVVHGYSVLDVSKPKAQQAEESDLRA